MQIKNPITTFIFLITFCCINSIAPAQIKILFDATKAEAAGNADWVIDADLHNLGIGASGAFAGSGNESNAQRFPTPAQPATGVVVDETYWNGGISFWGVDCAYKGYTVESLPAISGRITYNDPNNAQDLSKYTAFVVCEPNILFTATEKTAMLDFVRNGGGLFIIADHDISDRNNDGYDSPTIWNDFFQTNTTGNTNPFGITFDQANFSETSSNISTSSKADTILKAAVANGWGDVTKVKWSGGNTMTINPVANGAVVPIVYKTGGSGNTNVMVAISRYGSGKVVAFGDSSPFDDGTGDPNDNLFTGYNGDVTPNHRNIIMNSTIWLVSKYSNVYTFTGDGNWDDAANWLNNTKPPATLPSGDAIIINPAVNGQCVLNVTQHISAGAAMSVSTGKNLVIPGLLMLQ